jgi:hypothetical protein
MALRYVLDENLRGPFARAVQARCAAASPPVDVTHVGGPPDLPLRTTDPDLLLWAERETRVIVTLDRNTMPVHHAAHLASGHHSGGVFLIRRGHPWHEILEVLVQWAHNFDPVDVQDTIFFIP